MLIEEDFHRAFQKLLERYNKWIAAGGDYFQGDKSFMCVLSIKVSIQKSPETYLMILIVLILLSRIFQAIMMMCNCVSDNSICSFKAI